MNYELFKRRVCEVEEAVLRKGYSPKALWRLAKVLRGDVEPPDDPVFPHKGERKYIVVKPYAARRDRRRNTPAHGHCIECHAPLSVFSVCTKCGTDNYYYIRLGITKKEKHV